jgi:putative FmdB family regulatory protein
MQIYTVHAWKENMPTYQYICKECDSTISHLVPINESLVAPKCLSCQKEMERIFAVPNIAFRGGGWGSSR